MPNTDRFYPATTRQNVSYGGRGSPKEHPPRHIICKSRDSEDGQRLGTLDPQTAHATSIRRRQDDEIFCSFHEGLVNFELKRSMICTKDYTGTI